MTLAVRLTESSTALKFAPQYIARELGMFADHGIGISEEVDAGPAGSWLVRNLHREAADVALGGVWLPYVYNEVSEVPLRPFLVGCRINPAVILARPGSVSGPFQWEHFYEKRVLLSLAATSQWMFLEGVLKEHQLDLNRIRFVRDLHTLTIQDLWRSGYGDYLLAEAATALSLVEEGAAQIASTMAEAAGPVPWSVYYAREDFIRANPAAIDGFRAAISQAVRWLYAQSSDESAKVLQPYFAGMPESRMVTSIDLLKAIGTWPEDGEFESAALDRYQRIMVDYGLLDAIPEPLDGPVSPCCG
ncbi:ABC transporter substrate-binding protein [Microbacterium sp. 22242]|uniref:ABC transporter substrate-binding protein n=1 Tax=Microbacterium sp. 22242 TaxID=3453896 RepID=UPI003F84E567